MRKSTLLIILLFCSVQFVKSQEKKILFIGNSYTFIEDIPNMFYEVANSTGDVLLVDSETNGGTNMEFHATSQDVTDKINSDNWDYVILQGQSVEVGLTGDYFDTNVAPFAAQLCQTISDNYSCTQPIFYNTWGRENGMASVGPTCTTYPWMCTYEGMDDALAQNYRVLADSNSALISPVGQVWRYIRENWSDIDLYIADQSHQSPEGAYASACTFYATILRKNPLLISYNAGLDEFDAGRIRNAVKTVVYDNLEEWKIGEFDPKADFTYSDIANEVTFLNASENSESYSWDFGDSNSSIEENPTHSYNEVGNYTVTLTVEKCGEADSYELDVNINTLQLKNTDFDRIKMIPNPSSNIISFKGLNTHDISSIVIYSLDGKKIISKFNSGNLNLDISSLKHGTYFVEIITNNGSVAVKKLIKN